MRHFVVLLLLLAFPVVGRAQTPTHRRIAVLDIIVPPQSNGSRISGRETAQVLSEALKLQGSEVVSRKDVEQAFKDFDFHLPLSASEQQVLGKRLNAERIVSGSLIKNPYSENPHKTDVYFALSVTDTITGDHIDPGIIGWSSQVATSGNSDVAQIKAAVQNMTDRFQSLIASLSMPIATVIKVGAGAEVTLNRGGRDGLHVGDEADVFRGDALLARLRLSTVRESESVGFYPEGGRRRVGDKALFLPPKPRKEQ